METEVPLGKRDLLGNGLAPRYDGSIMKIQYEVGFPLHPEIKTPGDWTKLPLHGKEYYADQITVVEGLVEALKKEALVVCTLYSPFMGGLERKGIIVDGSAEEIRQEVHDVLTGTADRHILGADCTLPGDIAWENIRSAIAAAHDFRR
ncbi:MAG: hypothetical protein ACC645_12385 [Pirellulales bacterium]